jgi:hypothetical protein
MRKRLNLPLSNGLCITSAKIKHSIATLSITDFVESTRIVFDIEAKKILASRLGIDIPVKDIEAIAKALSKA